ncbi:MAG: ATP-binding protein [Bacteroides sp.]|nr:ATP-binding protein [Bacteroides sp.]
MMIDCANIKYPVGIQSFPKMIEEGYNYVDKTRFVYSLVRNGGYYFLSRPRRFGKSLLLSTIEAYYQGRRDLFSGLALDSLTEEWDCHEILHLDLNSGDFVNEESLNRYLDFILTLWEQKYGITNIADMPSQRFGEVIKAAYHYSHKKVVILIDEYDKPMLTAIEDEPLSDRFRAIMKSFYSNLKSQDNYIKFAMLTGVSRFSKVSIFSDLNNLRDISFEPMFSGICGINNEELDRYFSHGIECLAERYGKTFEHTRQELKLRYDGYHFSKTMEDIYNPFSLVNIFAALDYNNYWIATGTPSYVVKLLKKYRKPLIDIERCKIKATKLATEGIMSKDLIPTLYQSGYLTIKGYIEPFDQYVLGYPNAEVEQGFIDFLLPLYLGDNGGDTEFNVAEFVEDIQYGRPDSFIKRVDSMLRGVPHLGKEDSHEHTFQNAIYLIFKMVGFYTRMEDHTSDGRIDMVITTSDYVYVFEFKVNKSAAEALAQIQDKEYWKKFESSGKRIFLIGANYNTATKALDDIDIATL